MQYDPKDCNRHFWEPDGSLYSWDDPPCLAREMVQCPWCGTKGKPSEKDIRLDKLVTNLERLAIWVAIASALFSVIFINPI